MDNKEKNNQDDSKLLKGIIGVLAVIIVCMAIVIAKPEKELDSSEDNLIVEGEVENNDEDYDDVSAEELIADFERGDVEGVEYTEEFSKTRDEIVDYFSSIGDPDLAYMNTVYVDSYAKDIEIINEEGKSSLLDLVKEENGLFVEFMGPWCPGCIEVIPELDELQETSGKKIVALGVNTQTHDELLVFKEEHNSSQDYYLVEDINALEDYGAQFVPILYYINSEGVIEAVLTADTPIEEIGKYLSL